MTFFNPPASDPPSWLDELRIVLYGPDKRWGSASQIDIATATREFDAWLSDNRPFSRHHRLAWESVFADYEEAVALLGPNLRREIDNDLKSVGVAARNVKQALCEKDKDVAAALQMHATSNRAALAGLQSRLNQPETRRATWTDLIDVCQNSGVPNTVLASQRDLFWTLLKLANYSVGRLSGALTAILGNRAYAVTEAGLWLGDLDAAEVTRLPNPDVSANMGEAGRLALCQRLITGSSSLAHHVIWVAFENAHLLETLQPMGALTFYNNEYLKEAIKNPNVFPFDLPEELKRTDSFARSNDLPEDKDVVLVRVDLGHCILTDPAQSAQEQASHVVTMASFYANHTRWRPLQGYLHAVDGRISGRSPFMRPLDVDTLPRSPHLDPMSDELKALEKRLAQLVPVTNVQLLETIEALNAWHEACRQSPLSAIVLHVRIIELISSRVSGNAWHRYLDDYLMASWIRERIHNRLLQVINRAAYKRLDDRPEETQQTQAEFRKSIFAYTGGYGFQAHLDIALDALPFFASTYHTHEQRAREIRELAAQLATPTTVGQWRDSLKVHWDLTRLRLQRLRNSLAHGGPVDPGSVETVHSFVKSLAATSLAISLRGLLDGRTITSEHKEHKQKADSWFASVASASDVKSSLFRP